MVLMTGVVNVDTTINLGHIITIATFLVGGFTFVWLLKLDTAVVKTKLEFQDMQMNGMQQEIKKIGEILIDLAHQDGRLNRMEDRIAADAKRLDDLANRYNLYSNGSVRDRSKG